MEMWPYDICYVVCAISYIIAKTFMIHQSYLDELKVDELWMDFLLVICAISLNFAPVFVTNSRCCASFSVIRCHVSRQPIQSLLRETENSVCMIIVWA